MAKLHKQYYYSSTGERKVNCYHLLLTKQVLADAKIKPEDELKIETKNDTIIIKKI